MTRASHDLLQSDDPEQMQFSYLMGMEAVLSMPAEELGYMLQSKAREIRTHLAEGMPRVNA